MASTPNFVATPPALDEVQEALRPLFDALPQLDTLPLLVAGPGGAVLSASPDPHGACRLRSAGLRFEEGHEGHVPACPITSCPHHPRFRTSPFGAEAPGLSLVHCGGGRLLEAVHPLACALVAAHFDRSSLLDELARVYEEINWLYNFGVVLKQVQDGRTTLTEIFRHVESLLPLEHAELWTPETETKSFRRLVAYRKGAIHERRASEPLNEALEKELRELGLRVLRHEAGAGAAAPFLRAALHRLGPPLVALSLETKERFLGLLLLKLKEESGGLTSNHLKLLGAVGRQVSLCLHLHLLVEELSANEGLRRELAIAREIQRGLLPESVPKIPGYDLFAGCITAAHVGGDYYDFFELGRELGLLIADVSGHSVASGLVAMSFRTSFHHHLAAGVEIDELFRRVNRTMCRELRRSGHFLSAFFAVLDPASGRVRYVNAGHNRPFIYRKRLRTWTDLEESGLLLGILENAEYPVGKATLEEDDILLLYTDGIVEAENQSGGVFGLDRLKDAVDKYAAKRPKELYHYLLKEMYVFQDERFNKDDVTLVVLKAGSRAGRRP